jgi:hypothetical protein
MRLTSRLTVGTAVVFLACVASVPALAAKRPPRASGGGSGSLTLVPLYSHTGGPVIGDDVTFSVTTSVSYPYVRVNCSQKSVVYSQEAGFFPSYPWGQTFQLGPTYYWASGPASCRADLENGSGGSVLASITFTVSG